MSTPGTKADEHIRVFLRDLAANRPVLIVDRTLVDGDRIPPLDRDWREVRWAMGGQRDTANLALVFRFVADHCVIVVQPEFIGTRDQTSSVNAATECQAVLRDVREVDWRRAAWLCEAGGRTDVLSARPAVCLVVP